MLNAVVARVRDPHTAAAHTAAGWVPWVVVGIALFPFVVLTHELGHLLLYRAFGFSGATLHYASADYARSTAFWDAARNGTAAGVRARAAAVLPPWQVLSASAGGLVVTYASVAAALDRVRRRATWAPSGRTAARSAVLAPLAVGVALAAPLRFVSGVPAVIAWVRGREVRPGTDEGSVALLLGIPPGVLAAVGLVCLAASWWVVYRYIPRTRAAALHVGLLAAAAAVGGVAYATVVGPWVIG